MPDSLRTPDRIRSQAGLPPPRNLPAARPNVFVSGSVEDNPVHDARMPTRSGVVVPVETGELHDEPCAAAQLAETFGVSAPLGLRSRAIAGEQAVLGARSHSLRDHLPASDACDGLNPVMPIEVMR